MPTVFEILLKECKQRKYEIPDLEKRAEIGKIIIERYFQLNIKMYLHRIDEMQYGREFKVLTYPKVFSLEMKKIICDWLKENSMPKAPKKNRPDLPINDFF